MRLLLDESLPRKLKRRLAPHQVRTVPEMGWGGRKNGELLRLAQDGFDVLVTADQSLPKQQNLRAFSVSVVVLAGPSNRLRDIEPLVPELLDTLKRLKPGALRVVTGGRSRPLSRGGSRDV